MKRLMIPLALVAAIFGVMAAQSGIPEDSLSDCLFVRHGYADVALDTLWFTTLQSGAGTGLDYDGGAAETADHYGVASIPYAVASNGEILSKRSRVKKVLLYSKEPFQYHVDYAGGYSSFLADGATQSYVVADTVDVNASEGTEMSKFPCRALVVFPDSIVVKEGGSDTVRFWLGY